MYTEILSNPVRLGSHVAALHIDPQTHFYKKEASNHDRAFCTMNDVAYMLRPAGILNIWALYTGADRLQRYADLYKIRQTCLHEFQHAVTPHADDMVLEKPVPDAFGGSRNLLENFLEEMDRSDLVITGGDRDQCVAQTIWGALKRNFTVYAVADAINIAPHELQEWRDRIVLGAQGKATRDRFHVVTSGNLMEVLASSPTRVL